jgi:hypothetical protein
LAKRVVALAVVVDALLTRVLGHHSQLVVNGGMTNLQWLYCREDSVLNAAAAAVVVGNDKATRAAPLAFIVDAQLRAHPVILLVRVHGSAV